MKKFSERSGIHMMKILRLVRVQLWAVIGDMLAINKSRRKKPKLIYVGVLSFILLMSSISFFYCYMIGFGLKMYQSLEILPALMMSVTCLIILMTTLFKVKGTIFGFRDYDMVMSLPISTGAVVASRLIILYALNFMFVIIMLVPMMVAYGILARPELAFYLITTTAMFFVPLVPIVLASFLGTIVAYAASRFRHSNLFSIVFSLVLLSAFMGFSFMIKDGGQGLVDMGKALTEQVNSYYPLAQMFSEAVVEYNIPSFVLFLTISAVAFFLYTVLVKLIFKKMNTVIMTGRARMNYKMGELKTASPIKALYQKELRRYFSSVIYVVNSGFGIVMLTLGAIALNFVDLNQIFDQPEAAASSTIMIPVFIIFCIAMTCTTMSSVSLEGRNLWIIKSLPVTPKMVYLAKAAVNLTILTPVLLDVILIGIAMKLGVTEVILLMLISVACSVFIAFYGLLINLLLPNFSWTSEVIVIKQSAACIITIFSGIAYAAVQPLFLVLMPSTTLAYVSYLLLTVVLDIGLYMIIMTYGKRRFYELI